MGTTSGFRQGMAATAASALVAGVMFGAGAAAGWQLLSVRQAHAEAPPDVPAAGMLLGRETIADMVDRAGPAVVNVTTTLQSTGAVDQVFGNDPNLKQFFGSGATQTALGTGFVVTPDGTILTNEHVIHGATDVQVTVQGHSQPFAAHVVGSDAESDVAVLKIDAQNLAIVPLGDSDKTRVGEWVIAVGNPQGLSHTTTVGVISAKGRPIVASGRRFRNLLQTDAAINPGNSGGPLLNLNGEVIGINNAVSLNAQGIGFAIPINTVKAVEPALLAQGRVIRPWLGVYLQDLSTPRLAAQFGVSPGAGVAVTYVVPGSPAATAGLKQGDVIQQLNRQAVSNPDQVVGIIQSAQVGDQLLVLIWRNGGPQSFTVTLTEKPAER